MNFSCYRCGTTIGRTHFSASDQRYHKEHFTCSICKHAFGRSGTYYRRAGEIFCFRHYATSNATCCQGCDMPILSTSSYVGPDGQQDPWHRECFKAYSHWKVRIKGSVAIEKIGGAWFDRHGDKHQREHTGDQVKTIHDDTLAAMSAVMDTMLTFQAKSENSMTEILFHVSCDDYEAVILSTSLLVSAVGTLFIALDHARGDSVYTPYQNQLDAAQEQQAKEVFEACTNLFKLIERRPLVHEVGAEETQEFLPSLTRITDCMRWITHCLRQLTGFLLEFVTRWKAPLIYYFSTRSAAMRYEREIASQRISFLCVASSDTCAECGNTVDSHCFKENERSWHLECLSCTSCSMTMAKTRLMHPGCFRYTCHDCGNTYTAGYVTTFSQRRHLLWVGMARLMSGLQMDPGALSRMSTIMH
jgi:hypothetical protein